MALTLDRVISAGTTIVSLNEVIFANANGISFGANGNSITASHNALTSQSNQALSASNGSFTFQTASFGNINGFSFYTSNGSMVGSYTVPTDYISTAQSSLFEQTSHTTIFLTSQSNQAWSGSNASSAFQTLVFNNANGVSWSNNAGSVEITHELQYTSNTSAITSNALNTSQSSLFQQTSATSAITSNALNTSVSRVINLVVATNSTGGGTVSLSGDVSFSNANNFTFYSSAGNVIVGSFLQSNDTLKAGTGFTSAGNNISMSGTLNNNGLSLSASVNAQSNQNISLFALGNTTQNSSTVLNASNLSLNAIGSLTVGYSNGSIQLSAPNALTTAMASNRGTDFVQATAAFAGTNASGTIASNGISISVAAPGAAAENNNIVLLGANTTNNTTASGSTIGWSGDGVTLGATNGSQVLISAPGTSSISGTGQVSISVNGSTISIGVPNASTYSVYNPYADLPMVAGQVGQGTLNINPDVFPNFTCDRVLMPINNTNSSNSSGSHTLSFWLGIYTLNASTLSLLTSQSTSVALTHSGTAGSYSLYSGMRHITMALSTSFSEGRYFIGVLSRTTSGGANGSYSQFQISNINSNFLGYFGSSHNTTYQYQLGQGVYSATTSAMPASIAISQIRGSDSMGFRSPAILFANGTI